MGEVSSEVAKRFSFDEGDLAAVTAIHASCGLMVVASYHGEPSGIDTLPMMEALDACSNDEDSPPFEHKLLIGTDANTHEKAANGKCSLGEFMLGLLPLGITTCWGDRPEIDACRTRSTAHTFLQ